MSGQVTFGGRTTIRTTPEKYKDRWYLIPSEYYPYTYKPRIAIKYEKGWHLLPAYSVPELGEMLPKDAHSFPIKLGKWECVVPAGHDDVYAQKADTEADARAKMLIYLLENNLV